MKQLIRQHKLQRPLLALFILLFAAATYQIWVAEPVSAAGEVDQVWRNVQQSDSYTFTASVENKTIPLPTVSNIGRFSKTDTLYLEGENNLRDEELLLALWGGGVNVLDQNAAYQLRLADGQVETRVGDEEWQPGDDLNVGFAPGGDFLAFLDVATDVAVVTESAINGTPDTTYTIYQFNVDGPAYAQRLTHISQEHLVQTNQLPSGVALQIPEHLQNLTGSGELWVDARGLPVREIVTLNIPAAANTDYRTEAKLDIQFNSYEGVSLAAIWSQPGRVIGNIFARLPLPGLPELGFSLTALAGVSLFMVVIMRPNRRTQRVVFSVMVALMLFAPLAQAQAASEKSEQIVAFKDEQEEVAAAQNTDLATLTNTQPTLYTPPATPNLQPSTLDTDEDGLTDAEEELLGTNRLQADSDFDGSTDRDEITGFTLAGQTWYGNPTVADSNNDSVLDGQEWNIDTDGDNTPDLYDFDDDGDGVPDQVDISRLVASRANNGTPVTFTQADPLQLTLTGLNPGRYTYVDLQLRPTNPDRLWYAFNVLNWPKDEEGNMQDWDNATFFDYCVKNGGTNCTMSPDDNGDIKFVPMLEVTLPNLSNLPRTSSGQLDQSLLDKYGISIQPAGNGSYYAYVPLNLVEDPVTGAKVAFQAKLVYQAGATWTPQQARLVWTVTVLNENYEDADAAATTIRNGGGVGQNQTTILHAYTDNFYLTGLNVHESHNVAMAIVYEDPAVDNSLNDDDGLMQMTQGLDNTLFVNRDCDFVNNDDECVGNGQRDITINEIYSRWNHPTNTGITDSQRWGIPDQLRVETYTFPSEDHALFQVGGQIAPNILATRFQGSGVQVPNLLFVRENRFRALNADVRSVTNTLTWNGQSVAVDFRNETETVTVGYNMSPYRYNTAQAAWEAFPLTDYADHVRASFAATDAGLSPQESTTEVVQASALVGTVNIMLVNTGQSAVISTNGSSGQHYLLRPGLFEGVNLSDDALRAKYLLAINTTADRLVQFVRFVNRDLFTFDDYTNLFRTAFNPNQVFANEYDGFIEKATLVNKTKNYTGAFLVFNSVLLLAGLSSIIAMNIKGGKIAGEAIALSVNAVGAVIEAATTITQINQIVIKNNPTANSLVLKAKTLAGWYSFNHVTTKLAAVGMVIGLAITWIVFFAAWGTGGLAAGSIAFNTLLATTIASTLVIVITFFVSLTVVGAIVLAIFAVFDLLAFIICKAGAKGACDIGITAAITQALTDWIYQGEVMIDLSGKPPISNIDDLRMKLTNPEQGLVVGNSVRFQADMFTLIRHNWPKPSVVYHYGSFYTAEDLQSASVVYSLTTSKTTLNTERGRTTWLDAWPYDEAHALVPSPGVGWLIPTEQSKVLWQAARNDTILSPVYDFTTPQINQEFSLWLNTGMALPSYDCWFSVCSHKTVKSPNSTDLTGKFVLDILPNSITGFYNWSALGPQTDFDGDGIPRLQDPNDTRWDTDSDGVPDQIEIEYGSSVTLTDKDGDSLNDALEIRYSTNPNRADTDGDGLTDAQEVNGYLVTIAGYTFRVTSDPLQRDADKDGISDGTEYRLNQLDPVLFPFHPDVFNDSPVRLYTNLNDDDLVLAVSAQTIITTTVFNGLPENSLLAGGRFTSTLPVELGGTTQARNFTLLPSGSTTIVQNGTALVGSTHVTVTTGVAADVVPVGTLPAAPFTDIILDNPVGVIIDNDNPVAPTLTLGNFVEPGVDVIIGGTASDPTSYIALVEVSVNGGAYITATGTSLWAFPVFVPSQPTGSIPIAVRVTDAVGHTRTGNFSLTIDGVSPITTLDLSSGQTRVVRRNAEGEWTMALSGSSSDALAGVSEVSVQIGSSRAVTVTDPTGAWTLDYPFDDIAFNNDPNPTGPITMTVTTRDNALPTGNAVTQIVPFVVDMTPPTVDLLSHGDDFQLTDGIVLTGTVQDEYTAVSGVEIAFVSAETVFATSRTWLHLPLNDLPETVLFNNVGGEQTQIYCLDFTCPDSYVSGTDGTAAAFDGNDILRSFEDLTLPASERTIALWFNTTCANCGLFSSVQGDFPTLTEHDHDIFLDAGKVCVSFITGPASRELRCSVDNSYNDGQWHQIVHTLGNNGNSLYLDGELAVSSPTTGSTFTTPNAVLVGYSPAAATPYFTGQLDDVVVYDGDMSATVATSLYRQWQPVTFTPDGSPLSATWAYTVPLGIEGYYQIDMRAADTIGNRSDSRGTWPQFRGPIDTKAPTFNVAVAYSGSGSAAQTLFTGAAYDANLTTTDYDFVCDLSADQLRYATDPTELEFTGQENARLTGIEAACTQNGFQSSQLSIQACDAFGHCAAAVPPQTVAYIGTSQNRLKPVGSLPNGIERTVMSDPQNRDMLIERPGQIITDIVIDETHGKLYWGEMNDGAYNQPASIWRANLDGSSVEQIIPNLTAYAPEALQIAVDPVGNKLYWTQGYQLWWANLDGTLPQVIYAVPDDPGTVGGLREYHHIGDVAVDLLHGRLILSERRLRFDRPVPGINIFNHSLLVATQLNGTSPQFIAGVGPGCTYANFYQNVGSGIDPTLCVDQTGGMDVESVTVVNGTAYWTAVDPGWTGSAVYGQPFGGATFTVAPLELNSSYPSVRMNPLPHLYIPPTGAAAYVSLTETIVRGETGGEFSIFSNFRDETPAPVGTQARLSSQITALAVTRTEQVVQTQPDLAVSLTSPAVVMLDGDSSRYDVVVRNNSGLPADSTELTLALPTDATFTGSDGVCAAASTTVTCDLGRFPSLEQQTIRISFTIAANTLTQLSATATVASATADANPNDNSATSNSITAAPTLAALPGVPYVYYSNLSHLIRVPLIGDPNPEHIQFDNGGTGSWVFAIDNERGYVFISNGQNEIARVNLDGTNYTVIGSANPGNMPTQDGELSIAVDTASGRVYWTEVVTMVYTRIRSANNDGSDVQTIVPIVYGQKGLLFDPIRNLLYWVGLDSQQRQYVIYRSNPDGSNVQVVYTAAAGAQIRNLALDPYAQKLYWIDGITDEGTLFRADSDGGHLVVLDNYMGSDARGVVVLPAQNTLYYSKYGSLYQAELDGTNQAEVVWLGNQRYYGVSNLDATVFPLIYINPPTSNLAYGLSAPYAASPCVAADPYELNDTPATATTLTAGTYAAAICRSSSDPALGLDKDVYQVVVPAGQAITATLSSLPADYGLYIQRADFTVDVSSETGTVNEQVVAANYEPTDAVTYTLTVFPSIPVNNFDTYQLDIELGVAPPNGYTNAQCLAVDPNDLPGEDGNHTFANATPLTVGTGIQGALCYENDSDFFKFTATAGQVVSLDLPVRPADYSLLLYAPDGSFRQSFIAPNYAPQVTLDVAGEWRVLVRDNVLTPTNIPYQLLVTDLTCGQNDSYEPNNVAALAADLTGTSRVFASLCAAADMDYYTFQSGANQQLTLNYPANPANATITLYGSNGELGRLDPGTQGKFNLSSAGWYTLTVANSGLSGSDALYMFQWQVAAPSGPNTGTPYVYYTDAFHFTRVALSADHIVEPLLVDAGALTWDTLATDTTRGWLYFFDLNTQSLMRSDLYGTNPQTVIANANPNGISVPHVAIAVDEASGRIYWLQPTGASASTASFIMRSNGDGTGTVQVVGNGPSRDSLVVDPIKGVLYWTENESIRRSDLDGNNVFTLYTATSGNQVRDLAFDPYAQNLYWMDPNQQTLFRANSDGTGIAALVTGLSGGARGVAIQPLDNALYYSNGTDMMRAQLDGSGAAAIATLSGTYLGPSNLNPGVYLNTPIGTPGSSLAFGYNTPIVSPCALADLNEPNNGSGTATPLTVITQTVATGALCNTIIPNPTDMDYYHVTLADQKVLTATLTNLPADYRLVIIHPNGYAAAFSDNAGLTEELGIISNTSGAPVEYDILVMSGTPVQNYDLYQLTLTLGDVPPPPDPDDADCYYADPYDAPAPGGNGTIGTATDLTLDVPVAAALCYSNDVDMYGFDGLDGQRLTIDLPIRPDNYTLTLYDPSGTAWATPAYGSEVTLDASGRWTIAVSHVPLTPTTSQYQLLVTDESCVSSDTYEPNDSTGEATLLSNNSRVRASLCSDSDVDTYHIWAIAGQQLTVNYPTNNTGSTLAVSSLGTVNTGTQGQFAIASTGWVTLTVSNNALSQRAVPYLFQLTLGAPTTPTSDTPYVYYSNTSDLTRVAVITRTIEPILMGNGAVGGITIASDMTRGKLYLLDHFERIVRINFDGTGHEIIIPDADPNNVLRFANGLAVDESSGRIYWMEPQLGVVTNLMSANGDGTDVQTLVTNIANERAIAIDPVAGWVYWVQHSLYNGDVIDQIRRANLDGSDVTVVYAAPSGREIRDLTVDPYHQKLYWLDPTLRQVMWADSDGSDVDAIAVSLTSPTRGVIVRPLNNELYYTSGLNLVKATLSGGSPTTLARLEGSYSGVSNLDPGVFYLTGFSTPSSNLILGLSTPYAQPCTDAYEPNNSAGSAAAISTGSISSVLCTSDANQPDTQDYYEITVPDGQQVDVTLTDLPQDYGLGLLLNGTWVDSSYTPDLVDEAVTGVNETGAAADYTILVERFGGTTSSNVPYTLTVNIGAPTPPPPPPPPPGDPCPAVDAYDAYGALGNGSFANASPISFNTPITAALCYQNDLDMYIFSGVIGQNVTVDLPVRPANYYVFLYKPDGSLFKTFHPAYSATYGDSITLSESGNWYVGVWQPTLSPTTDQYQLFLGVSSTCSGLDPYEPNNEQGNEYDFGTSPPATLSAMLCETSDTDLFTFDVVVGQRVRITPQVMTPGMDMIIGFPGGGYGFTRDPIDSIMRNSGQFTLGFYSQEPEENLPYEVSILLDPVPTPTPLPNNWSCTTYPSTDIPQPIDDLTTVGSMVTVPASGTVTHVGIRDLTFDHGGLWNLSFSLGAPDGTIADLFSFDATGNFYVWCGGPNCQLSLDDGAIPGLIPPQFPNNGGTYQPNLSSFAPFNGLASQGTWTLFITDNFAPEPGDTDAGDTTGDLFGWELEVCVDNGNPPDPTPTPSPTSTPPPQPTSGTPTPPVATSTPAPTPTATATSCAVNVDAYESDDTPATASIFDMSSRTSGSHTFHTFSDKDWMSFSAVAGREYTFSANKLGTNAPVSLAIYRSDGTTLEVVYTDEISFTPTVAGDYYLVAGAVTGTSLPCNASYNVALTVTNPDATPIPTPSGTPPPPDHQRPPVSSAIITPTNGTAMTAIAPITVDVGLAADNGIGTAVLHVNGATIDNYTAPPSLLDTVWQPIWTPAQTGVYTLTAYITATNGLTATSPVSVVYVDTANPTVNITTEVITQALLRDDGLYGLHGTTSDDSRVRLVEVQIDGGTWQEAVVSENSWLLPLAPLAQANPNGGTLAITVRATDMAGRSATDSANLTLDVVAPDPFTITTSLTSGVLISPTQITAGLDSRLSWPVIPGAVNVYAGWSAIVTPTLGTLTMYGAAAGSHDQLQVEATARYGHVVAVDANGNQTIMTSGPFYFDSPQTPDLISSLDVSNWTDSGGKQVAQMNGTNWGTQQLFAGWNASHLRLRWDGANVDGNGDLYFYLGTTAGGSTDLLNPFGPDDPGVLPFAADYVIHVSSGLTATLYSAGSGWTTVGPVAVTTSGSSTDLLIPFASLGIATPASASLQLLGVASEESTLAVWATLPDKNLKQPNWTQYIQWSSLGSGIVPANGVWADAQIEASLSVYPDPSVKAGVGDTITLTLTYSNTGTATLPQLTLDGTGSGGFVVNNGPQTTNTIQPGSGGTLTLLGTINASGSVDVTLADSYHRPYAVDTLVYTLDSSAPVSISIALEYVGSMTNTIKASAEDESPLATIEVEIDDGLPFGPTGIEIVTCVPGSGTGNAFVCNWNAGTVTDGNSYTLRGRATDIHGNVSGWSSPINVIGDATAPVLTLGTVTQAALSDNKLGGHELVLDGTVVDERAAATTQVCLSETITVTTCLLGSVLPAPDNTWSLALPGNYNGITGTLSIVGFDKAGNPSNLFTQMLWLDTVSPVISTTVAPSYLQMIGGTVVTFTSGTAVDASGLMSATVVMLLPNGNSTIVNGTVNGNTWQVGYEFTLLGDYEAVLILTDSAGNRRYSPIWQFEVGSDPTIVRLLDIYVAERRVPVAVLGLTLLLLLGLVGLTFQFRSRLGVSRFR